MGPLARAFWLAFFSLVILFGILVRYESGPTSVPAESTAPPISAPSNASANESTPLDANASATSSPQVATAPSGPTPGG